MYCQVEIFTVLGPKLSLLQQQLLSCASMWVFVRIKHVCNTQRCATIRQFQDFHYLMKQTCLHLLLKSKGKIPLTSAVLGFEPPELRYLFADVNVIRYTWLNNNLNESNHKYNGITLSWNTTSTELLCRDFWSSTATTAAITEPDSIKTLEEQLPVPSLS